RQVQSDLDRYHLAVDLDAGLAVEIPAERAGGEFLHLGLERDIVDGHAHRLGFRAEFVPRDRTGRFLGHGVPPWTRSVRRAVPAGIVSPTASGILSRGGPSKQGRVRLPVLPTLAMLPSRCGGYNEDSMNATIADATAPKGRLSLPLWTEIHAAPPL